MAFSEPNDRASGAILAHYVSVWLRGKVMDYHDRIERPEIQLAVQAAHRVPGLSKASRRKFAMTLLNSRCARCAKRLPMDDRTYRKIGSTYWLFHEDCVEAGVIQKRADLCATRTPAAIARARTARAELERSKRRATR